MNGLKDPSPHWAYYWLKANGIKQKQVAFNVGLHASNFNDMRKGYILVPEKIEQKLEGIKGLIEDLKNEGRFPGEA